MNLEAATVALLDAARASDPSWSTGTDEELLADGAAWEALGRIVDAQRLRFAGEVEQRSTGHGEGLRLPARHGLRDGADLVAWATRVSRGEAVRRVALGTELAPRRSLTGEELPGRHPVLADAVRAGDVGVDSARIITGTLRSVRRRADPERMAEAEAALTEAAVQTDADGLRALAASWAERLDPDGPQPREHEARRKRSFKVGRADEYGGSSFFGYAPPEDRALLAATLAAYRRNLAMTRSPAGDDTNDGPGPEWRETDGEQRTVAQLDFDTLASLLTAGVRASASGTTTAAGVRSIPEVIVTTTVDDLERRTGSGVVTVTGARISVESVERLSCGGRVRLQVNGRDGEPLWLGHPTRLFSPAQRKALIATSGGCRWPGCTAPPAWCDVHHIAWYRRDDGPTDIDNGVLLCSFHHHLVHDPACARRIVMHDGQPHLVPRSWTGPPDPGHRMPRRHERAPQAPPADLWGRPSRR